MRSDDIALLIKQGEQFIASGDVVTARIVFLRAAEAGDPNAAVALGATYDPTVLARLGVVGMAADVEKARSWYQKAESLGSPEASRRLRFSRQPLDRRSLLERWDFDVRFHRFHRSDVIRRSFAAPRNDVDSFLCWVAFFPCADTFSVAPGSPRRIKSGYA